MKVIWFVDQANYDILKTKIDVTDNTNPNCVPGNPNGCYFDVIPFVESKVG